MIVIALVGRIAGATLAWGARAASRVAGLSRALRHRAAVFRLAELDDRLLVDLGVSRSQVLGALDAPLHADPSAGLARGSVRQPATARPARAEARLTGDEGLAV